MNKKHCGLDMHANILDKPVALYTERICRRVLRWFNTSESCGSNHIFIKYTLAQGFVARSHIHIYVYIYILYLYNYGEEDWGKKKQKSSIIKGFLARMVVCWHTDISWEKISPDVKDCRACKYLKWRYKIILEKRRILLFRKNVCCKKKILLKYQFLGTTLQILLIDRLRFNWIIISKLRKKFFLLQDKSFCGKRQTPTSLI